MAKSKRGRTSKKSQASSQYGTTSRKLSSSAMNTSSKNGSEKETLEYLFEEGLKDVYSAELQLIKAIPEMAEAAYSEDLRDAFHEHLEQTKRQAERLEKIFNRLQIEKGEEDQCVAMKGLIEEGNEIIEEFEESPVRDAALIIGSQKIEHYEIAAYGSLCELADVLGYSTIADILERTLDEEKTTDLDLTAIAQEINDEAYEISREKEMQAVY